MDQLIHPYLQAQSRVGEGPATLNWEDIALGVTGRQANSYKFINPQDSAWVSSEISGCGAKQRAAAHPYERG